VSALLEVSGLTVGYGDIVAVRDVAFDVQPGSVQALLGRNGAGKTTTLRGIAGLSSCPPGSVLLDGVDISRMAAHRRAAIGIAFVQEGKRVFRQRTVEENLLVGCHSVRLPRRQLAERIEEAYTRFPVLADRRAVKAGAMSGGQQQMLAIASALVSHPRIVMLDEPSAGLAPTIVADVLRVVQELREEGMGVILVEQAVEFAFAAADSVVVVDLGRVVLRGSARDDGIRKSVEDAYMGRGAQTSR
jgi:branched-chain amino acid transport system ATP-binding protein